MTDIYAQLAAEHGYEPARTGGRDDELVERTWNGLRVEDQLLPQPPQDPDWRLRGDR